MVINSPLKKIPETN